MSSTALDRLRAADAAGSERDRLIEARSHLVAEITTIDHAVRALAATLGRELADVQRFSGGELAALANPTPRIAFEQREAFDANARYRTALGEREMLVGQIANIDGRLAMLTPEAIAREQQAARVERRAEVAAGGGAAAAALMDLEIRLESIDIELTPLATARLAGDTALAKLAAIATLLAAAVAERAWRKRVEAAATEARAHVLGFRDALAELAVGGGEFAIDSFDTAFLDGWAKRLLEPDARAAVTERIELVQAALATVHARFDEIAGRRAAIARELDDALVTV